MSAVGLVARVLLGGVFLVSSMRKLPDVNWPVAARRFGLPQRLAWPLAAAELVLGALLLAQLAAAAWAALALLLAFTAAITTHVVRGDDVPCACFGPASSTTPVSWRTVARNLALTAVALAATA